MALDLITFAGPTEVQERSSVTITAKFRDATVFADAAPTNVYWRLDDAAGQMISDWTSATPPILPANSVAIPITGEQNRVLNEARDTERKVLTVMADRGLATQFVSSYQYQVRNLGWLA